MSNSDLTSILLLLLLLVSLAQLLGYLFTRLRQPKVVGEILAGVVLGPALLGKLPAASRISDAIVHQSSILNFVYWLGLLLLMFLSGAETQQLFTRDERREVGWLTIVGTGIPFCLGLIFGPKLISPALAGPNGNDISLIIILAVGVAVTSVPVVSRIFADLKILHTRFARIVLGVAVLEDMVLWLALAIATALAGTTALSPRQLAVHLGTTIGFFGLALTVVPRIIKHLNKSPFNVFAQQSPIGYAIAVLLAYWVVAGVLNVSLVFAAFLAGFAVVHKKRRLFANALDEGFVRILYPRLLRDRRTEARPDSRLVARHSRGVCDRKLRGEDRVRLAGGTIRRIPRARSPEPRHHHQRSPRPGHRTGQRCIRRRHHQPQFYTTLIVGEVFTSQVAGAWLGFVLARGWPLLTPHDRTEPALNVPRRRAR